MRGLPAVLPGRLVARFWEAGPSGRTRSGLSRPADMVELHCADEEMDVHTS